MFRAKWNVQQNGTNDEQYANTGCIGPSEMYNIMTRMMSGSLIFYVKGQVKYTI